MVSAGSGSASPSESLASNRPNSSACLPAWMAKATALLKTSLSLFCVYSDLPIELMKLVKIKATHLSHLISQVSTKASFFAARFPLSEPACAASVRTSLN